MEIRKPDLDDADRIREVARSSMTTSYRLSPGQIDTVIEAEFNDDHLGEVFEGSKAIGFVAEDGEDIDTVAGVAIAEIDGDRAEVRWLFVDPEHRGTGIGTELFETTVEALRDRDVDVVQAVTLEANTEGQRFFERFDFIRTDDRSIEIADESFVEYVYTEPSAASEAEETDSGKTETGEIEFPDTEMRDGVLTATTEDGQRVYINREDDESGTEAPFYLTYEDEEFSERFGYYCANCGSMDIQMDSMERLQCDECGNSHASRSEYDSSYL